MKIAGVFAMVILNIFINVDYSFAAEKKERADCETLHTYFTICYKLGAKPLAAYWLFGGYTPEEPEYCEFEAQITLSSVTTKDIHKISNAMPLLSKKLDETYQKTGISRDEELDKKYGRKINDFKMWCIKQCDNGLTKGGEFMPYIEFVKNCPEKARK